MLDTYIQQTDASNCVLCIAGVIIMKQFRHLAPTTRLQTALWFHPVDISLPMGAIHISGVGLEIGCTVIIQGK